MVRVPGIRLLLALAVLLAVHMPVALLAQDDSDEIPLGDVARSLRKNTAPVKPVIDDDNLSDVMARADSRENGSPVLRYLMSGDRKGFQMAAPDVTCSLAFTANVKSLLSSTQYSQMDLPVSELPKLEGPATIEGDALNVTLFNATNWHVSEIAVAFTLVKKVAADGSGLDIGPESAIQELRPEKKQDTTIIYKMRAAAPPWMRAAFSAQLNLEIAPSDEWHWAIVQAKGYPPQRSADPVTSAAANNGEAPAQPSSVGDTISTPQLAPVAQQQPQ